MTVSKDDQIKRGSPALAGLPPAAKRSEQLDSATVLDRREDDEPDLQDISQILLGAQAISGKAMTSAYGEKVRTEAVQVQQKKQKQEGERTAQEARELANLAEWNKKKTVVAGVEMTNEDAQKARRRFIENEDRYADEAVKRGFIRSDQRGELKQSMRDKTEWQDREGRGIITDAERRAEKAADASEIGRARDRVTAHFHQNRDKAFNADMQAGEKLEARATRTPSASGAEGVFDSAPNVREVFSAKASPTAAIAQVPPIAAPSRKAESTGLDL